MDDNEKLSPRQIRVIPYLLVAPSIEEGCKRARISKAAVYEWLKDETFRRELKRQRDAVIERALDTLKANIAKATETLVKHLEAVTFIDGTREQQEARLKELRADPRFQVPWAQNGPPVCFEGGASCDDIFLRIHEKEQKEKIRSNEQKLLRSDST